MSGTIYFYFFHILVSFGVTRSILCQVAYALSLLPLSPADCRFYLIWSFSAPCLTAFQVHFLPALLLAAFCRVSAHVNSGIGWYPESGQDKRAVLLLSLFCIKLWLPFQICEHPVFCLECVFDICFHYCTILFLYTLVPEQYWQYEHLIICACTKHCPNMFE